MNNCDKSLDALVSKEEKRFNEASLREQLLLSIHKEAYDDTPIDHEWVTSIESQAQGIITAFAPNHSFVSSSPEENHRVVMEALDAGKILKGTALAALAMLVFRIFKVLTTNKSFTDGSRGTAASFNTLTTQVKESEKTIKEEAPKVVAQVETVVKNNKAEADDESPVSNAVTNLLTFVGLEVKQNEDPADALKRVTKTQFTELPAISKELSKLPNYMFDKDRFMDMIAICSDALGVIDGTNGLSVTYIVDNLFGIVDKVHPLISQLTHDPVKVSAEIVKYHDSVFDLESKVLSVFKDIFKHDQPMRQATNARLIDERLQYIKNEFFNELIRPIGDSDLIGRTETVTQLFEAFEDDLIDFNKRVTFLLKSNSITMEQTPEHARLLADIKEGTKIVRDLNIEQFTKTRIVRMFNNILIIGEIYTLTLPFFVLRLRQSTDLVERTLGDINTKYKKYDELLNKIKNVEPI